MPTYDYQCNDCGTQFELVQSFSANTLKKCPKKAVDGCANPGKGVVHKRYGNVGISFKGSGFYKNDSRGSKSSSATSESSSDSSSKSSEKSSSSDSKSSDSKSSDKSSSSSDSKSTVKSTSKSKTD